MLLDDLIKLHISFGAESKKVWIVVYIQSAFDDCKAVQAVKIVQPVIILNKQIPTDGLKIPKSFVNLTIFEKRAIFLFQ